MNWEVPLPPQKATPRSRGKCREVLRKGVASAWKSRYSGCYTMPMNKLDMIGLAFTPEQFKTLLRMVYLANTIANGQRETDHLREYDDLEQYIFSRAGDAGFPAATFKHKALGETHHHPSQIFENDPELNKLMDEYEMTLLLEHLSLQLAERDIEQKEGIDAKNRMPAHDYEELLELYAEMYESEFNEFGFDRLIIEKTPREKDA